MNSKNIRLSLRCASDGAIAVVLMLIGIFKIPSFIPGAEFQLSAPFAVAIAKNLGFKRYIIIGAVASLCGFILGLQNIFNIIVAMVYRVVAGLMLTVLRNSKIALIASGPCGTLVSRVVLACVLGADMRILILYAMPGMAFTAIMAPIMTEILKKMLAQCCLEERG